MNAAHPPSPAPPKYHLLEVTLAARIRDGAYDGPGLPGERGLASEFGVARVTVRNALRRLEQQGLVVRRPGSGTLPAAGRKVAPDRRLLREHLDQFVARGRKDKRSVLEFGLAPARPAVAGALEVETGSLVLRVVRVRTSGGVPLAYTEAFVPERLSPGITRAALNRRAFVEVLEAIGVKIGIAEQGVSAEAALPPVHEALRIPLGSPVLRFTRLIRDEAGRPAQLLLGWYRSDRFEFRMRLSRMDDATRVWMDCR